VNAREASKAVRELAKAGRIVIRPHARQRMGQRAFTYEDVKQVLSFNHRAVVSGAAEWEIYGKDLDGTARKIVVEIQDNVIVITVV
jgi:hypothetical protein